MSRRAAGLLPAMGLVAGIGLLTAGCVGTPAADDPTQVRIEDMDTRLGRIERIGAGQSLVEMSQRIDALQAEVRALRGQLEVLENGNEALRKQQRDLYADLDKRIAALEGGVRSAAPSAPGTPVPAAGGAAVTPEVQYGRAFDALKSGNYAVAIAGMRDFLARHPDHDLADNAQYWLGEAYYVTRDYEHAIEAFGAVGERWPQSSKAADAALKLGFSQFELKRYALARQTLARIPGQYPGTEAARLAQERLRRIP